MMPEIPVPNGFRLNTHGGDVVVPAGATMVVAEDGEYQGYVTAEGEKVGHWGQSLDQPAEVAAEAPAALTESVTPDTTHDETVQVDVAAAAQEQSNG